jgi:hypothetical protein
VSTRRLLLFLVVAVVLIIAGSAGPALAVNDPFTPAETCDAEQGEAVGHPAADHEQSDQAGAPFSANNPSDTDGAEGNRSVATANCANNQPE